MNMPSDEHRTNALERVELAGVSLNVAGLDPAIRAAIVAGTYEAPELQALAQALRPGDTVLELGTGLGLLSTFAAQRIGGERVHTFEANPALEPRIRETWALNGVAPTLTVAMLGEHAGEHDFHVHDAFWASSATDAGGATRTVRVPVLPLNEHIRRIRPNVLVMDIEGGEAEILRVADLSGIERIVAEFHERMLGRPAIDAMFMRLYGEGFAIVREASAWEGVLLERVAEPDPARHVSLQAFMHDWRLAGHWVAASLDALLAVLPEGSRYALIDGDQWGALQVLPGRLRVPFTEREGRFAGQPADDAQALDELARQRAGGLRAVVFSPESQWWLAHYTGLAGCLQREGRRLASDGRFEGYLFD